eukprot:g55538.t1
MPNAAFMGNQTRNSIPRELKSSVIRAVVGHQSTPLVSVAANDILGPNARMSVSEQPAASSEVSPGLCKLFCHGLDLLLQQPQRVSEVYPFAHLSRQSRVFVLARVAEALACGPSNSDLLSDSAILAVFRAIEEQVLNEISRSAASRQWRERVWAALPHGEGEEGEEEEEEDDDDDETSGDKGKRQETLWRQRVATLIEDSIDAFALKQELFGLAKQSAACVAKEARLPKDYFEPKLPNASLEPESLARSKLKVIIQTYLEKQCEPGPGLCACETCIGLKAVPIRYKLQVCHDEYASNHKRALKLGKKLDNADNAKAEKEQECLWQALEDARADPDCWRGFVRDAFCRSELLVPAQTVEAWRPWTWLPTRAAVQVLEGCLRTGAAEPAEGCLRTGAAEPAEVERLGQQLEQLLRVTGWNKDTSSAAAAAAAASGKDTKEAPVAGDFAVRPSEENRQRLLATAKRWMSMVPHNRRGQGQLDAEQSEELLESFSHVLLACLACQLLLRFHQHCLTLRADQFAACLVEVPTSKKKNKKKNARKMGLLQSARECGSEEEESSSDSQQDSQGTEDELGSVEESETWRCASGRVSALEEAEKEKEKQHDAAIATPPSSCSLGTDCPLVSCPAPTAAQVSCKPYTLASAVAAANSLSGRYQAHHRRNGETFKGEKEDKRAAGCGEEVCDGNSEWEKVPAAGLRKAGRAKRSTPMPLFKKGTLHGQAAQGQAAQAAGGIKYDYFRAPQANWRQQPEARSNNIVNSNVKGCAAEARSNNIVNSNVKGCGYGPPAAYSPTRSTKCVTTLTKPCAAGSATEARHTHITTHSSTFLGSTRTWNKPPGTLTTADLRQDLAGISSVSGSWNKPPGALTTADLRQDLAGISSVSGSWNKPPGTLTTANLRQDLAGISSVSGSCNKSPGTLTKADLRHDLAGISSVSGGGGPHKLRNRHTQRGHGSCCPRAWQASTPRQQVRSSFNVSSSSCTWQPCPAMRKPASKVEIARSNSMNQLPAVEACPTTRAPRAKPALKAAFACSNAMTQLQTVESCPAIQKPAPTPASKAEFACSNLLQEVEAGPTTGQPAPTAKTEPACSNSARTLSNHPHTVNKEIRSISPACVSNTMSPAEVSEHAKAVDALSTNAQPEPTCSQQLVEASGDMEISSASIHQMPDSATKCGLVRNECGPHAYAPKCKLAEESQHEVGMFEPWRCTSSTVTSTPTSHCPLRDCCLSDAIIDNSSQSSDPAPPEDRTGFVNMTPTSAPGFLCAIAGQNAAGCGVRLEQYQPQQHESKLSHSYCEPLEWEAEAAGSKCSLREGCDAVGAEWPSCADTCNLQPQNQNRCTIGQEGEQEECAYCLPNFLEAEEVESGELGAEGCDGWSSGAGGSSFSSAFSDHEGFCGHSAFSGYSSFSGHSAAFSGHSACLWAAPAAQLASEAEAGSTWSFLVQKPRRRTHTGTCAEEVWRQQQQPYGVNAAALARCTEGLARCTERLANTVAQQARELQALRMELSEHIWALTLVPPSTCAIYQSQSMILITPSLRNYATMIFQCPQTNRYFRYFLSQLISSFDSTGLDLPLWPSIPFLLCQLFRPFFQYPSLL